MLTILTGIIVTIGLSVCNEARDVNSQQQSLPQTYCSSCHLPVSPDMLDSITWIDHVLPAMAPKLGVGVWGKNNYFDRSGKGENIGIGFKDWMDLVDYYKKEAPKKLPQAKAPVPLKESWAVFKEKMPPLPDTTKISATTLVKFDTIHQVIYSADANSHQLISWNFNLKNHSIVRELPSPAVDLSFENGGNAVLTTIGTLISNNLNQANGKVFTIDLNNPGKKENIIADHLPRPVKAVSGDFNRDGLEDWIVCGFGHDFGGLYLFQQKPDHQFEKMVISEMPGAEQAITGDFNNDGWPDIMVLFAQAREGIWLFLNNRRGGFSQKVLLEFPPVYGSTSFQLIDFNNDGKKDILYTAGDNADYSSIFKPYHGVYIFLNKGDFKFDQKPSYFYPVNGCTKAIAADFDGDGDLDIVSIAFFANFKRTPSESFIYFEQDKPLHFIAYSIPISGSGRWISMDVADFYRDGRSDVVLGNFSSWFGATDTSKGKWNKYIPLIVLKNISR